MVVGSSPPRKTFTPTLIAALVGLLALAIATVIVVIVKSGGDSSDSTASSSSATSGEETTSTEETSAAEDGSLTSSDGAFTYQMPSGYEDATGKVTASGSVAQVYKPDSDASFPITIIVTTEPAKGTALSTAVSNARAATEKSLSTTTELMTLSFKTIDGEEAQGFATKEYQKDGQKIQSAIAMTIHNDVLYAFIVNVKSEMTKDGGNGLADLIETVTWT